MRRHGPENLVGTAKVEGRRWRGRQNYTERKSTN